MFKAISAISSAISAVVEKSTNVVVIGLGTAEKAALVGDAIADDKLALALNESQHETRKGLAEIGITAENFVATHELTSRTQKDRLFGNTETK